MSPSDLPLRHWIKPVFWIVAGLAVPCSALGHDLITTKITWSREISRLVQDRCISCHNAKGTAFPLSTYEQARPWAKAIKEEVLSRRMPPWGAVKGYGDFQHDPSLTQEEISLIAQWVEGGAPSGDPALLPPERVPKMTSPAPPTGSRAITINGIWTAPADCKVVAIQPVHAVNGARVSAYRPDGTTAPLLWVYEYPSRGGAPFLYRTPVVLPAGTRVEVRANKQSSFTLWISQPATKAPQRAQ